KSISTSDKLHYLKRYVSGPAYKCVEGTFYRDDEEAYKDAWNKLNQRLCSTVSPQWKKNSPGNVSPRYWLGRPTTRPAEATVGEMAKGDASTSGYGQCSYLRLKNEKGEIHCVLVMGKARVSPMKVTTIPRVQKIRQGSSPKQWFYVSTDENPADNASRGTSIDELLSSNWFTGPQFLWEMEIETPVEVIQELPVGDPEVRKAQTLQTKTTEHLSLVDRLSKFSSWSRVIQAVARLVRRVRGDKSKALST
ncbi:hypothetical protein NFI96_016670, partial [Prochilodus magdalenae]